MIVSAFFCCGKSFYATNNPHTSIDLDYEDFAFIKCRNFKVKNPRYPNNYLNRIMECRTCYEYIFVSTRLSVRQMLIANNIPYILVYPEDTQECYKEWHDRCFHRGTVILWDEVLRNHFSDLLKELKKDTYALKHYTLQPNEYIDSVIH